MSNLVETLYPLPDLRRTPWSLIGWWESRRLKYNLVVGAAGLVTLGAGFVAALVLPWVQLPPTPLALLAPILVYAIAANGCYTLGWLVELAARAVWGPRAPHMGPLLFREGLIFSVGLTLMPILLLGLSVAVRVVGFIVP